MVSTVRLDTPWHRTAPETVRFSLDLKLTTVHKAPIYKRVYAQFTTRIDEGKNPLNGAFPAIQMKAHPIVGRGEERPLTCGPGSEFYEREPAGE